MVARGRRPGTQVPGRFPVSTSIHPRECLILFLRPQGWRGEIVPMPADSAETAPVTEMTPASAVGGEQAPVELSPRQKSRLENMPAEARKVIEERKKGTVKNESETTAKTAITESTPAAKPAKQPTDGVIDLSLEGDSEATPMPDEDVDIEGLDDAGRKKLKELNHKTSTYRRRTQEAEKNAKEAADKITAAETRLKELETELESARTAPKGNNWYATVTDDKQLSSIEEVANRGLKHLHRMMLNPEADREFTFLDGSKRELTADDLDTFTTAITHVNEQRDALKKRGASQESAKSLITRLIKIDGFKALHKKAQSADWDYDRPTLAAKLAVAELALSGQYVLVPKGKNLEKAAGANSPAQNADMAPASAPTKPAATPPREIAGTMPSASQGDDFEAALSSAKARAAKGDPTAVRDMLRIKRERRMSQHAA